jgi:hypothetical protein
MPNEPPSPTLERQLTTNIVAAYVRRSQIALDQLGTLISTVHQALIALGKPAVETRVERSPAVPIGRSVHRDYVRGAERSDDRNRRFQSSPPDQGEIYSPPQNPSLLQSAPVPPPLNDAWICRLDRGRALDFEILQSTAQNLAGQGLRQFVNELDGSRILVRCSHRLGMSLKFCDERA